MRYLQNHNESDYCPTEWLADDAMRLKALKQRLEAIADYEAFARHKAQHRQA